MTNAAFKSTTPQGVLQVEKKATLNNTQRARECRRFWLLFRKQTCLCEREDGLEVNVGRLRGRVEERGFGPGLGGGELPAKSSQSLKLAGERRGSHGAWLSPVN